MDEENEIELMEIDPRQLQFFRPENGAILLDKVITPEVATKFVDQLFTASRLTDEPLVIFFNSPGGDVYSTLMIMNAIQSVENETIGIVLGWAGSGAFYAFQSCTHRVMAKLAILFWHEMIQWDDSPTTDAVSARKRYEDYKKLNDHVLKIFKKRINLSVEDWNKFFGNKNDISFNASESLKANLADKTLNKLSDLKTYFKKVKDGTK